ncbi:Beige/BEACH_domain-containing protein [Hexamita inflata]|uniref:Beige/BEACH domain-containing protein n=1 Tax=Hexamita inflata TaxID=28002 RepID=A0AA86P6X1_9EUKA|nr:Beige/BEACH domain-containing protein [Hexamita inflata]
MSEQLKFGGNLLQNSPSYQFFNDCYEFHSQCVQQHNSGELQFNLGIRECLQVALKRVISIHQESENTLKPQLSSQASIKLIQIFLRVIIIYQQYGQINGILQDLICIFDALKIQEQNYFDVNKENEEAIILLLQTTAAECGMDTYVTNQYFNKYSLDCSAVYNEISNHFSAHMILHDFDYSPTTFSLSPITGQPKSDENSGEQPVVKKRQMSLQATKQVPIIANNYLQAFKLTKYIVFNTSRLYYLNELRLTQLILGLQLLITLLSQVQNNQDFQQISEYIQTPEVIFSSALIYPKQHQIFKQYMMQKPLDDKILAQIGFLSLKVCGKLFEVHSRSNQKMNQKLFNANFCSNFQKFFDIFIQQFDLISIQNNIIQELQLTQNQTINLKQPADSTLLYKLFNEILQKECPELYVVSHTIQQIHENLAPLNLPEQQLNIIPNKDIYSRKQRFLKGNDELLVDKIFVNMDFPVNELSKQSYLKNKKYETAQNYLVEDFQFNPFISSKAQYLQMFQVQQDQQEIYDDTVVPLVIKNIEEHRLKLIMTQIACFSKDNSDILHVILTHAIEDFSKQNAAADHIFLQYSIMHLIFTDQFMFRNKYSQNCLNFITQQQQVQTILNLCDIHQNQMIPIVATSLKLMEQNPNNSEIMQISLQIIEHILTNDNPLTFSVYQNLTESQLLVSQVLLYLLFLNQIVIETNNKKLIWREDITNKLQHILLLQKISGLPPLLTSYLTTINKLNDFLASFVANYMEQSIESNNYEAALQNLLLQFVQTYRVDFTNEGPTDGKALFTSKFILKVLQNIFDLSKQNKIQNKQVYVQASKEITELIQQIALATKNAIQKQDKNYDQKFQYLSNEFIPSALKLVGQISIFNNNVIPEFFSFLKKNKFAIGQEIVTEILDMIALKKGHIYAEPVQFVLDNMESMSFQLAIQFLQKILDMLQVNNKLLVQEINYYNLCQCTISHFQKVISYTHFNIEQKTSICLLLSKIASQSDSINLNQILQIFKIIQNPDLQVPFMHDFLESLANNIKLNMNESMTQFSFQKQSGLQYCIKNLSSSGISIMMSFRTRLQLGQQKVCLFSIFDQQSNQGFSLFLSQQELSNQVEQAQLDFVLTLTTYFKNQTLSVDIPNLNQVINQFQNWLSITFEFDQEATKIQLWLNQKRICQNNFKTNIYKILNLCPENSNPVLLIAKNPIIDRYKDLQQENCFIGSVDLFAIFNDVLSDTQFNEVLQYECNYQSIKNNKLMRKCSVWLSPYYILNNHVLNVANQFTLEKQVFGSLQNQGQPPLVDIQNDLVGVLLPGSEIRQAQPITFQLQFVYGVNIFLCLLQALHSQQIVHQKETLTRIMELIYIIIDLQHPQDLKIDMICMISLLRDVPVHYFTETTVNMLFDIVETEQDYLLKTELFKFLTDIEFWRKTSQLQIVLNNLQAIVENIEKEITNSIIQSQQQNDTIQNSIVFQATSFMNGIGFSGYDYVKQNKEVFNIKQLQQLIQIQEKAIQNAISSQILQGSKSSFQRLLDLMQWPTNVSESVDNLIVVLLQKAFCATGYILQSQLSVIRNCILCGLLSMKHIESLIKISQITIRVDPVSPIQLMVQKLLQLIEDESEANNIDLILTMLFVYSQQITSQRNMIEAKQLKPIDSIKNLFIQFYQIQNADYLKVITEIGMHQSQKKQIQLLSQFTEQLEKILQATITANSYNYRINLIKIASENMLALLDLNQDVRIIINYYPISLSKDVYRTIANLISKDENLYALSTQKIVYDSLINQGDLSQTTLFLEKLIDFIFTNNKSLQLARLLENLPRLDSVTQEKIYFLLGVKNAQIAQPKSFQNIQLICQNLLVAEQFGKTLSDQKVMVTNYLNEYFKQLKKRKDDFQTFIRNNIEMQALNLFWDTQIISLKNYVSHMLFNDELIFEPAILIPENSNEVIQLQQVQKQSLEITAEIQRQKQVNITQHKEMSKSIIGQILQRAAISQVQQCKELSEIENQSRIRNKVVIPLQKLQEKCNSYIFRQEQVIYVNQKKNITGTLCITFNNEGNFTLYFISSERQFAIEKIKIVFQQRFLFEWNSIEIVTRTNEPYYFQFPSVQSCKVFLLKIKKYCNKTYQMNKDQKQVEKNNLEILELQMQFTTQFEPEEQDVGVFSTFFLKNVQEDDVVTVREVTSKAPYILDNINTQGYTSLWQRGIINNYDYLMILNSFAGRTFADLAHYPVFPWVIKDYSSESIDIEDISIYRDFSLPIGAQGLENKINQIVLKYRQSSELVQQCTEQLQNVQTYQQVFNTTKCPSSQMFDPFIGDPFQHIQAFHHACLYQTPAFVCHFLVRLQPFTQKAMELDKRIDVNRGFTSIPSAFSNIWANIQDNRELIPEFFTTPQFLIDQQNIGIGNVELPPWSQTPEQFIRINRNALESEFVSQNLHLWIDLIFGFRQQGTPAAEKLNTFGQSVFYENQVMGLKDPEQLKQAKNMAESFGHVPAIIFNEPHVKRQVQTIKKKKQQFELCVCQSQILNLYLESDQAILAESTDYIYRIEYAKAKNGLVVNAMKRIEEPIFYVPQRDVVYESETIQVAPVVRSKIINETNYLFQKHRLFKRNVKSYVCPVIYTANMLDDSVQIQNTVAETTYLNQFSTVTAVDASQILVLLGCADGTCSLWTMIGVQPVCCLHEPVISVSINCAEDLICVATQNCVQLYSTKRIFITEYQVSNIVYVKVWKKCVYIFTKTHIYSLDHTLCLIKQVTVQLDAMDIKFGQDSFLVLGEHRVNEHKLESMDVVQKRIFSQKLSCCEFAAGEQIIVIGCENGDCIFVGRE